MSSDWNFTKPVRFFSKKNEDEVCDFVLQNRQLTFSFQNPFDFISLNTVNSLNNSLSKDSFKNERPFSVGAVGYFSKIFSDNSSVLLDWLGIADFVRKWAEKEVV